MVPDKKELLKNIKNHKKELKVIEQNIYGYTMAKKTFDNLLSKEESDYNKINILLSIEQKLYDLNYKE